MCTSLYVCMVPINRGGVRALRYSYRQKFVSHLMLNSGPLIEQKGLVTTNPSLQPH